MGRRWRSCAFLLVILMGGGWFRLNHLGDFPRAIYGDEAAIGYNAYSILQTGRDEYGTRLPLQFRSFNDDKAPLAVYLTAVFIKLFGLNVRAIRLPSAVLGTLSIPAVFWLARRLLQSETGALISALLLAVSPWHIHVSRAMFEANVSLSLFLFGVAFYFAGRPAGFKRLFLSALLIGLSLYAYHPAKLLAPVMIMLLLAFFRRSRRENVFFAVVFALTALPFLVNLVFGRGEAKYRQTVIWRPSHLRGEIARRVDGQRALSELPSQWKVVFYNKPVELSRELVKNYLKSFGVDYLYLAGEASQRLVPGPRGMFYVWELPLFLLGFYYLLVKMPRTAKFVGFWMLAAPLPAALTGETYALRNLLFLPWPQLVEGFGGACFLAEALKTGKRRRLALSAAALVVVLSVVNFWAQYFYSYGKYAAAWWGYGERQAIELIEANKDKYDLFFLQDTASSSVTYAFYAAVDPRLFQKTGERIYTFGEGPASLRIRARRFGRVMVGSLENKFTDPAAFPGKTMLILLPGQSVGVEPDFTIDDPADGRHIFEGFIAASELKE